MSALRKGSAQTPLASQHSHTHDRTNPGPGETFGLRFRIPAAFAKTGPVSTTSAKAGKIAAAIAAVQLFLQEEQIAAAVTNSAPPHCGLTPWGLSARLATVAARMGSLGSRHTR